MRRQRLLLFVTVFVTVFVTALAAHAVMAQRSGSTIAADRIFEALAVREGGTICEIGAGDGELSIAAARLVGPNGQVYASELGDDRVRRLRERVEADAARHITVVTGDPRRTNFSDAECDALFMRNVYHHFAEPAVMNASIAAALKPGGRLAIVDFAPSGSEAARAEDRDESGSHGVAAASVSRELKEAGFEPVSTESGAQRWFMVVVAKPRS